MALETLFSQCITEIMAFQAMRLLAGGRGLLQVVYFPKTKAVNEGSNQDLSPLPIIGPADRKRHLFPCLTYKEII